MACWLRNKLLEKCTGGSGRPYRNCCLGLEVTFAGIAVIAAASLLAGVSGQDRWMFTMAVCGVLAAAMLAGWWVQKRFR